MTYQEKASVLIIKLIYKLHYLHITSGQILFGVTHLIWYSIITLIVFSNSSGLFCFTKSHHTDMLQASITEGWFAAEEKISKGYILI